MPIVGRISRGTWVDRISADRGRACSAAPARTRLPLEQDVRVYPGRGIVRYKLCFQLTMMNRSALRYESSLEITASGPNAAQ